MIPRYRDIIDKDPFSVPNIGTFVVYFNAAKQISRFFPTT